MAVRKWYRGLFFSLSFAIAIIVVATACSSGSSEVSTDEPAASTVDGSEVDGTTFSLHGDWVIDVIDPDGTVASHHEFTNALGSSGPYFIASYLATSLTPGNWRVILGQSNSTAYSPCINSNGNLDRCFLIEAPAAANLSSAALAANYSTNLNVAGPASSTDGSFVLSGSVTAGRDAQLSEVNTTLGSCSSNTAPDDCVGTGGTSSHLITSTNVTSQGISVTAGQTIMVTVTLAVTP